MIAGGALVVALLLWAVLISPQNSKLSSLQNQQSQLQSKEATLQAKLATLRTEKQKLSSSCADLEKISTQIPSVQSPTDIDAEESTFESQFNGLAAASGVTLAQFSGFAPASTTSGSAATATPSTASTTGNVTSVPTNLTVTGNYGQLMAFINGLDSFPRLFVIQKFVLAYGSPVAASSGSSSSSSSSASSSGSAALGETAPSTLGRWDPDGGDRRPVQPVDHRLDLLHVDAERPRRLLQGHRDGQVLRPDQSSHPVEHRPRRTPTSSNTDLVEHRPRRTPTSSNTDLVEHRLAGV